MRNLFFFLIAFCGVGCAQPVHQIHYRDYDPPSWLSHVMHGAVDFWNEHDVDIAISADQGSPVGIREFSEPKRLGEYHPYSPTKDIWLSDQLPDYDSRIRICALAHEIGHMLGMKHVSEDEALMRPNIGLNDERDGCEWSESDEEQLKGL